MFQNVIKMMFQNVIKLISFKSYNMFDGILKHKEEIDLFGKNWILILITTFIKFNNRFNFKRIRNSEVVDSKFAVKTTIFHFTISFGSNYVFMLFDNQN
jgi:hypothetical protein